MVAITYVSVSWVGSMRILKGFCSLKTLAEPKIVQDQNEHNQEIG